MDDDLRIDERIKLLKLVFYFDSMGEAESLEFLNKTLKEKNFKRLKTNGEILF